MIRLIHDNGKNSPEEYDRIFKLREKKGPDWSDIRRWEWLVYKFMGGRILDIGCLDSGVGQIAYEWNDTAEVWGIDLSTEAIQTMQKRYPDFHYEVRDAYDTKFPDEMFDYIVIGEVLEHSEDPHKIIKEAMRILAPGGVLALSVPKDEYLEPGAVDGDRHIWSFSVDNVKSLLKPYGTVKIKVLRSRWFPKYRYCWPQILAFCTKQ